MPKDFKVKSWRQYYHVNFVDDFTEAFIGKNRDEVFVIADEYFRNHLKTTINGECVCFLEASEENKTLKKCEEILTWLIKQGFRRNHTLMALGGGVVQDVTAFVSTILYRGIDWVFIPTTLLAQADSCIGSKSSINFSSYKNLLGSFYPPTKIFIDTQPST